MKALQTWLWLAVTLASLAAACRTSPAHPNTRLLTSPADLARRLDEPWLRIIDARPAAEYAAGHVPGARSLPVAALRDAATQRRKPAAEWALHLGSLGITRTANIIVYDDPQHSQGAAGYVFWALESLGCAQVALLDGGWPQWLATGQRTTTYPTTTGHIPLRRRAGQEDRAHAATNPPKPRPARFRARGYARG